MFKRILALTLVVALVAALWIVPSMAAAPDMSADKIADFDFSEELWKDETQGMVIASDSGEPVDYRYDDEIGLMVAAISAEAGTQLKFKTTPLSRTLAVFTVEMFVKISTTDTETERQLVAITNDYTGLWEKNGVVLFRAGGTEAKATTTLPRGEWVHVVGVRSAEKIQLYVNGSLAGEAAAANQDPPGGSSDSIYVGSNLEKTFDMELAKFRMYKSAATAENVTEWYTDLVPADDPTPTPTPELPELPTGEDYEMTAEKIPAFKAGDQVKIKTNIKVLNEYGIAGLDLVFAYNDAKLEFDQEATEELWESRTMPGWWQTAVVSDKHGIPEIDVRMADDDQKGIKVNEETYVELVFTALEDSAATGELVGYSTLAMGMLLDPELSLANGTGLYLFVEAEGEEPSETPSETPSESPSEEPTTKPDEPVQPPTFDAGIISLAAVAISSVVAVKKRKIS